MKTSTKSKSATHAAKPSLRTIIARDRAAGVMPETTLEKIEKIVNAKP